MQFVGYCLCVVVEGGVGVEFDWIVGIIEELVLDCVFVGCEIDEGEVIGEGVVYFGDEVCQFVFEGLWDLVVFVVEGVLCFEFGVVGRFGSLLYEVVVCVGVCVFDDQVLVQVVD